MATGIPGKKPKANKLYVSENYSWLEYKDKKKAEHYLQLQPPELSCFWQSSPKPLNRLYFADNLLVLASLLHDDTIKGQVRLIYIDPPFSTQTTFESRQLSHAYSDYLSGAFYLEFLRSRMILLKELLANDGSIYIHLDEKMVFHAKVLMDEIFGPQNFRNCITRQKCNPKNYTRNRFGNISDYILFYTKSSEYIWHRPIVEWSDDRAIKEYQYVDPKTGRRFKKVPIHAPGHRNGETGKPWRGKLPPPGKHWQYLPSKLDEFDAKGEIYWSPNGNPRRIVFLDQSKGVGVQDIWLDMKDAHNQNICITGYPTEKNLHLLKRIVEASSNPGDIVLDCFSGSGTTLHAADLLGRRWIGIDNGLEAIKTTVKRFMSGLSPMGDFVTNPVASNKPKTPSLFDSLDDSDVFLNKPAFSIFSTKDQFNILKSELNGSIPSYRKEILEAETELKSVDPILGALIRSFGPCKLEPKEGDFSFLVDAIIGQQLSKKAADTIKSRFLSLFPSGLVSVNSFNKLSDEDLQASGISTRKISYLRDLAEKVSNKIIDFKELKLLSDEEAIQKLCMVKGIGPWTAQMYLIFLLNRLDIFPVSDVSLRSAITRLYKMPDSIPEEEFTEFAKKWAPYRSIASWYLYTYSNSSSFNNI